MPRKKRALALALPAVAWLAAAPAEAGELPCNRFAKVLSTGTLADRKALAAEWHAAEPAAVAKACGPELRRAFLDPLRAGLPQPGMAVRAFENRWLAAYLTSIRPDEGPLWIRYLDVDALDRPTLEGLAAHYASGPTTAAEAVFRLARRTKDPAFKNEALHIVEPLMLALEASDVTAATRLEASLKELGYGFLLENPTAATLWSLHQPNAPQAATAAELKLLSGDLAGAFAAYAEAARGDERFLVHAALAADAAMADGLVAPAALIPLGIQYRKCPEGYGIIWGFGSLRFAAKHRDPELRAEALRNYGADCNQPVEEDDEPSKEALLEGYEALTAKFGKTRAGARLRLAYLARLSALADAFSNSGRLIQGNEIRTAIYPLLTRPAAFNYLGGATRSRKLREHVASYLAFPPEPEVRVNDPTR